MLACFGGWPGSRLGSWRLCRDFARFKCLGSGRTEKELKNVILFMPWCSGDDESFDVISKIQDVAEFWSEKNGSIMSVCVVVRETTEM